MSAYNSLTDAIAKLDLQPNSIIVIDGDVIEAEQMANAAPDGYVGRNPILVVFGRNGKDLKDCIQQLEVEDIFSALMPKVPHYCTSGTNMNLAMMADILKLLDKHRAICIRATGDGKMDIMPDMIDAVAARAVEIALGRISKR